MTKRRKIFSMISLVVLSVGLIVGTKLVEKAKEILEGHADAGPMTSSPSMEGRGIRPPWLRYPASRDGASSPTVESRGIRLAADGINVSRIYPRLAINSSPNRFLTGCYNGTSISTNSYWVSKLWSISYPPTNGAVM